MRAISARAVESVLDSVARGVRVRNPESGRRYWAYVDMSGGSNDDATLAVGYQDEGRAVVALVQNQGPPPPFDPHHAVDRFAATCRLYGVQSVTGDEYAGETFKMAFARHGIGFTVAKLSTSQLYEALEPRLNARQVVLLDVPEVEQQLLGLVWRGTKIDHPPGEHDDYACVVAGVVELVLGRRPSFKLETTSYTKNFIQPVSGRAVDPAGTRYVGDGTYVTTNGERYRDPRY